MKDSHKILKQQILDANVLQMLADTNKKIKAKFGLSSFDCLTALHNQHSYLEVMLEILKITIGCSLYMNVDGNIKSLVNQIRKSMNGCSKDITSAKMIKDKLLTGQIKESVRPSYIRRVLSDNIEINYDTCSRALRLLIADNTLSRSKKPACRRGRKPDKGVDCHSSVSGPDSRYEASRYFSAAQRVLCLPQAMNLVLSLLLESGILSRYIYSVWLQFLFSSKMEVVYNINNQLRLAEGHSAFQMQYYNHEEIDEIRVKEMAVQLTESSLAQLVTGNSIALAAILPVIINGSLRFNEYNL